MAYGKSAKSSRGKGIMSIDKSRTSPLVKLILILIALALTLSFVPMLGGLFQPTASQYETQVKQLEAAIEKNPDDRASLVSLGNAYFDWAYSVGTAKEGSVDVNLVTELWNKSADAYGRAVALESESPVEVDWAIALFYGGNTPRAIEVATAVTERDPSFPQAWFNLGLFKENSGDAAGAKEAYEKFLETDPTDSTGLSSYARSALTTLGQ